MRENIRTYKTRKWTDKKFTEGADYICKKCFNSSKNSQLETTIIVGKLYACHCDSMKLVKETLPQVNRSKSRKI